jgi:hypothetical protein
MVHCSKLCFCPGAEARDARLLVGETNKRSYYFHWADKHTRSPFQPMQKYSLAHAKHMDDFFGCTAFSIHPFVYCTASVGKINSARCTKTTYRGSAVFQFMSDFIMPTLRATIDTLHTLVCRRRF